MTPLLEKLLDWIREWLAYLAPWYVLGDDEVGLVRRLGVYKRQLRKGWNWKVPVIDEVKSVSGAIESTSMRKQTLRTLDGYTVDVSGVLGYQITDPKRYILDCGDAEGVLSDIGTSIVGLVVPQCSLAEVMANGEKSAAGKCLERMRRRAERWGIDMQTFAFADRYAVQPVRLMGVKVEGEP